MEYKETFGRPLGERRLREAEAAGNFFFLEYPRAFLEFDRQVDAALLMNVVNIVPEHSERRKILRECAKRLRKGGLLLLMTQYGEPGYRPGVTKRLGVTDGWAYNLHRKNQTFNKEFKIPELVALVQKSLYRQVRKITSNHHHAFLFERR